MRTVTDFPRRVEEIANQWITLSDGCRVAARLWLPEDAASDPVPAILEYLPYRKRDGTVGRDALTHPYLAGHGYACLRVDIRGNGESEGLMEDEYTEQELADAVEIIDWIARQPWCTGKVGMMGISWGGFNGLQVAWLRPQPLKAVVTLCSTDDRYADDIHYMGGCLLNDNLSWSAEMLAGSSLPPDPALVGEDWRRLWLHRLAHQPLLAANWLRHQRRDGFWKHGSVCEDFGRIEAAVFAVSGWADAYTNAVPRLLAQLRAPCIGLIGPWIHRYPHIATPQPAIGFLQEMLRFWDYWLKGIDTGIMDEPKLRAYILDSVPPRANHDHWPGRWVGETDWPSPRIRPRQWQLNPGRLDDAAGPPTTLRIASPQTLGQAAGRFCPGIGTGCEFALDQRIDDGGALVFETAELDEDLEILGAPVLTLRLAANRPQANLIARLGDVRPDGTVIRVTPGVLNLTHRNGHEHPEPLVPGEPVTVRLPLNDIGYRFPAGHRIRLALSNAYWPLIWPSPEATVLDVFTQGSSLSLPVRPSRDEAPIRFPEPEGAPALANETLRPAAATRRIEYDAGEDRLRITLVDDQGHERHAHTGIDIGMRAVQHYTIAPDEPNSARLTVDWTVEMGRDQWRIRTESHSEMWSDERHFHLHAWLEAYLEDEQVFRKTWDETIARDGV